MSVKSLTYKPAATVQEIARLVTELTAIWNAHEIDRAVTFYAPEYEGVDVAQAAPQRGPDGIRQTMTRYLQAFPDLQFLLEDTLVQGDQAALFWTAQGTHQGVLMNIKLRIKIIMLAIKSALFPVFLYSTNEINMVKFTNPSSK